MTTPKSSYPESGRPAHRPGSLFPQRLLPAPPSLNAISPAGATGLAAGGAIPLSATAPGADSSAASSQDVRQAARRPARRKYIVHTRGIACEADDCEKRVRLQQGSPESLRPSAQARRHDSARRAHDRLLQSPGCRDRHRIPDADQFVSPRLCVVGASSQGPVASFQRGCLTHRRVQFALRLSEELD